MLLLADACNIVSGVDALKARARLVLAGLEAELSFVVEHRELGSEPPTVLVDRHRQPSPRDLEFTDAAATIVRVSARYPHRLLATRHEQHAASCHGAVARQSHCGDGMHPMPPTNARYVSVRGSNLTPEK